MPYNRQYMGATGSFASSSTVLFPPQSSIRSTDTSISNDPDSPVTIMRAAPNPNEIWRLQSGDVLKTWLYNTDAAQLLIPAVVYIGKKLLGGLGTRFYHVEPAQLIADASSAQDINFAQRMQQSMRVHAGEELIVAVNDGGSKAWDASDTQNSIMIPFEVAAGVSPAQNAASLRRWG